MKTLKPSQIESETIGNAIDEITNNHSEFLNAVTQKTGWAIFDAAEAIATHIIMIDEDYVIED